MPSSHFARQTLSTLFVVACFAATARATAPAPVAETSTLRARYDLNLALDFDARSFSGTARVRWLNRGDHPASALYFHLYANLRGDDASNANEAVSADEPQLEIQSVCDAATGKTLAYSLNAQGVLLRVSLREAVPAGAATQVEIKFKGHVSEIDADETSLPAHVVQQLGAALRDTREARGARDLNFRARGIMLLGAAYPVLAVRDGDDWQREVKPGIGDYLHTEVADYNVTLDAPAGVAVFASTNETSGGGVAVGIERSLGDNGSARAEVNAQATQMLAHRFAGPSLRNFAVIAGRGLRSGERAANGVRVRAVWSAEHEKIGRRVLDAATKAAEIFTARFGALPAETTITVAEAPLVAGLGSAEFAGLSVIASAFYVDFDAPSMRNLPEMVREQRSSVEDSLEFAAAHMVAHQWWGAVVGNPPDRAPVLDEGLAHWSALLYYREAHGAARAAAARDDQLRGIYEIYRTFGGEDLAADRAARDYRNSFQYAAIVFCKGALLFDALERLLGAERVFTALRRYYEANRFEIAEFNDLRGAFVGEATVAERRAVSRTFDRWLTQKHGDEDIAPPNPQLAQAVGLDTDPAGAKERNAFSRLGRFFWRQMTRIH